jgi:hypothetical protein
MVSLLLARTNLRAEDRFRTDSDGGEPPRTNPGTYPTHLRNPISGTHRGSPPVLATDPWGIGKASVPRMEVFVYLGREMPPDYMGRNHIRFQGYTVSEPDTGYDMERGTSPRERSSSVDCAVGWEPYLL